MVMWLAARPVTVFAVLSILLGAIVAAVTPPLRAPDELAHFVRAYGIAHLHIVPRGADEEGRKGLTVPALLAAEVDHFNQYRYGAGEAKSFRAVMSDFRRTQPEREAAAVGRPDVFLLYEGSEGYAPVPYVPAIVAIWIAEAMKFGFLPTLYLMRAFGLLAATAMIAVAAARAPGLKWAFVAIAMLPSALYGRSVVSADGASLALVLLVVALAFERAVGGRGSAWSRSAWTALCALSKPSQLVFVLIEAMARPWRTLKAEWPRAALVVAPALILCPLWIVAAGGDIATWRLSEGSGIPPEQFTAGWKLRFMLEHPLHFPRAFLQSLDFSAELWRQLIGVLGWLDTRLNAWVYPLASALLVLSAAERLEVAPEVRRRIALVSAATGLAYVVFVFLIFYVTSTPADADRIHGLQGRYFLMLLPLLALLAGALLPRGTPPRWRAGAAIALSILSGLATIEAILRQDWP